jgi:hypothetical protein
VFGSGDTHNPNHAGFPVVLDDGAWTNAADDWLVVDQG